MRLDAYKDAHNGQAQRIMRVNHPIYGPGDMIGFARGTFIWVLFDNPRTDDMAVLAVGSGVCGAPVANREDAA